MGKRCALKTFTFVLYFLLKMSVQTDQNDLLVLLEQAENGSELLEAIDAYQDGEVSFA